MARRGDRERASEAVDDIGKFLEFTTVVAANALRAHHVAIEGDFFPDETCEVTKSRVLAHACDDLVATLHGYRRLVLARLARERSEWPF